MTNITDEQIIKTWEKILSTGDAPIGEHWSVGAVVTTKLAKETLDFLNRQNAKIERLHEVINRFEEQSHKEFLNYMELSEKYQNAKAILEEIENDINPLPFVTDFDVAIRNAKSEVIKEVDERFKKALSEFDLSSVGLPDYDRGYKDCMTAVEDTFDSIIKEMNE